MATLDQQGQGVMFFPGEAVRLNLNTVIPFMGHTGFRERMGNNDLDRFVICDVVDQPFTVTGFSPESDEVQMNDDQGWKYLFPSGLIAHVPRLQSSQGNLQ